MISVTGATKRFGDFVAAENKKWGEVARIANVKLD